MSESREQVIARARKIFDKFPVKIADFAIAYHAEQTSAEVERLRAAVVLTKHEAGQIREGLRLGDTEELSITLTLNEWAAVGTLVFMALQAGCPASTAKTAYDKIIAANKQFYGDQWPESIGP